jgi:hypothetical protein
MRRQILAQFDIFGAWRVEPEDTASVAVFSRNSRGRL